jgi:hypothetical protein
MLLKAAAIATGELSTAVILFAPPKAELIEKPPE